MDIPTLEGLARELCTCGLSSGTVTSYTSAQRRYVAFCDTLNLLRLPLSERVLCLFVAYLTHQGLAHQSIITYLFGVRNLAIASGAERDQMPRFQLVLRGVARNSSHRNGRSNCLPITGSIMHRLAGVWSSQDFEFCLMWAATCVGYFGFMRVGEFTAVDSAPPNILMSEGLSIQGQLPQLSVSGSAGLELTPLVEGWRYFWVFQVRWCVR